MDIGNHEIRSENSNDAILLGCIIFYKWDSNKNFDMIRIFFFQDHLKNVIMITSEMFGMIHGKFYTDAISIRIIFL